MNIAEYSGAGNTFFLIDNRKYIFDYAHVRLLCDIKRVDGVILVEPPVDGDVFMRIFNRDSTEAEMCGNGLRCLIHFLKELGIERTVYHIDTLAGQHKGWCVANVIPQDSADSIRIRGLHCPKDQLAGQQSVQGKYEKSGLICVQLPQPTQLHLHIDHTLHFLNTGVPHAIIFVPSVENIQVELQGKNVRNSPHFAPAGTNVDFVAFKSDGSLSIRTYERGVEAETLACGTGATAAALIAHKIYHLPSPIEVWVRSGDRLKIFFNSDWSQVILQGPVCKNAQGDFQIKDQTLIMATL